MMRTIWVLLFVVAAPPVQAMTFMVGSTADAVDAAPGDGTCATAGSVCTLRAAIQEANALAGDDTIDVPAGTYTLGIPAGGETTVGLDAAVGDLDITQNLTITGAGAATTIVDGNGLTRVFHEAGAVTVTISGLTVRNGVDSAGAGIFALGSLTLHDVVVTTSTASGAGGGGIRGGAALMLDHATVSNNTSTDQGGGIFGGTPVVIDHSTIIGNSTPDQGAGIFSDGPLTITNSTVSGNSSTSDQGGGIFIENGDLTVVNSTISGNTASSSGGGIFNNPPIGSPNTVRILNTTITANTASGGGGVFTFDPGAITVRNTLLAANTSTSGSSPDAGGTLTSEGFNLIGSTDGATVGGDTTGNLVGVAPGLGPLADNGGPTRTHGLLAGSPAIDAGDPAGCVDAQGGALLIDQRDEPRPQGPRCDIGAVEGTTSTATTTTTLPPASCDGVAPGATFASLDCRLAALLAQLNASSDLGPQATRLRKQITKAKQRKEEAEAACRQPNVARAKSRLKKATKKLIQFNHALGSPQARKSIPDDLREQLRRVGDGIRLDMRALKRVVRCPNDAPAA